jgi:hypothetical protein
MKFRYLVIAFLFWTGTISAQTEKAPTRCGTKPPSPEWDAWFNAKVTDYISTKAHAKGGQATVTIPVVVHVIHGGQSVGVFPNISAMQIQSQINVLNDDFAGRGFNSQKLAATGFSAVGAADTKISFCLAQLDPAGVPLPEPGIDRVNYTNFGWTNPAVPGSPSNFEKLMDGTIKPNTIWDPTYYFNIWVSDVNPSNYLLGYATYPGGAGLSDLTSFFGTSSNDGIWIWGKAFGTSGTLIVPFNKGRTTVHETAHWLGLRHIGGDPSSPSGDCNASDFCNDTPPQKGGFATGSYGQNFGNPTYPLHPNVCASSYGDMFMNFMDYCDDPAMYMFTPDQSARMHTAIANGTFRKLLGASSSTLCTGLPVVDFINNPLVCTNETVKLVELSSGNPPTSFLWTADPSNSATFFPSNTDPNPDITFKASGFYKVTSIVTNPVGSATHTMGIFASTCTSISDHSLSQNFNIAPNPASDAVTIHSSISGSLKITVINSLGVQVASLSVYSDEAEAYLLNVAHLPEGVYFIHLTNGPQKAVRRVMIAR